MHTIPIENIIIPEERQRTESAEEHIKDLAESIRDRALLHPITLRDDGKTLAAGYCRLQALRLLVQWATMLDQEIPYYFCGGESIPATHAAYLQLHELNEIEVRELELEENVRRKQLSWQEEVRARNELLQIRKHLNPEYTAADFARDETRDAPAGTDTSHYSTVRYVELLNDNLDDPDIGKAKNVSSAMKNLQRKLDRQQRQELASSGEIDLGEQFQLHHGNFRDVLANVKDETFSCMVTDPPYCVGANNFGTMAQLRHEYEDSNHAEWIDDMIALARESYRVCTRQAHAYVFCDVMRFPELSAIFNDVGWAVWMRPMIWYKGNNAMLPDPERGPRRTYDCILYAIKGGRPVEYRGQHDVIVGHPQERDLSYAAQKPWGLYVNLLERSSIIGESVLDPFCGRGTIFLAAAHLKLNAFGCDMHEDAYALSLETIRRLT